MKVTFEYEKATKNTIRFQETGNDAGLEKAIGMLYIRKPAVAALLEGEPNKEVKLIVEVKLA